MRERELKRQHVAGQPVGLVSLPMRERELKHPTERAAANAMGSLPMRERELKLFRVLALLFALVVAPHAGARIETQVA